MAQTATLFNQSTRFQPLAPRPGVPPTLKKVLIVGGGSAGWMSAMILGQALLGSGVEITVLESPSVGIIGVGEGSTPWLRGFFEGLGIPESEWMPPCNATYKCGITFEGWSRKPGYERYFHPFASMLDNLTMTQFVHNVHARINGADVPAHPNRFFVAARLAEQCLAPKPAYQFPFDVWYGYHFDSVLLGQFLQKKAVERGVRHLQGHVTDVQLNERGDIASVRTQEGQTIAADFFVDCTGFASLLLQKALATPFVSYAENLFNDAAIAMPSPISGEIPSQTVSYAMRHGWRWQIPLTSRYGNGYVYSTAFCSPDEAERELRETLGLLDDPTPARHLKMRIGRVTEHWRRNCLAVGLSQGFIEPLEATALLFIQRTAERFVGYVEQGRMDDSARAEFNQQVNGHFEGTRDYIVTHYKTNSRTDTEYWRANAANMHLSDDLKRLLTLWLHGRKIAPEIDKQAIGRGYPVFSWYCLLAGMGLFPEAQDLRAPTADEARFSLDEIDNLIARSALNFPKHHTLLADIPPPRTDKALQIYFW